MKTYFSFIIIFILHLFFVSCSNIEDNSESTVSKNNIESFDKLITFAKFHSQGLDYVYQQMYEQTKTRSSVELWNKQIFQETAKSLSKEYGQKKEIVNAGKQFNNIIGVPTRASSNETIATDTLSEVSWVLYKTFTEAFPTSQSYDEMENLAKELVSSKDFEQLSSHDKELLTMVICVTLDSYSYWTIDANREKWKNLINNQNAEINVTTRGTAGPSASYWMSNSTAQEKQTVGRLAAQDGIGCLTSVVPGGFTVVGWLVGGIVGSLNSLW